MTASIRPAEPGDRTAVEDLLADAGLPLEGVAEGLEDFLVAVEGDRVVGAIGLETYEDSGLLRSAVIDPEVRSTGLGSALTEAVIARARSRALRRVFLLTTSAEDFFARFGFHPVERERVPRPIRRSPEFASVCPSHATVMVLDLDEDPR